MQFLTFIAGLGILLMAMKLLEHSLVGMGEGQLRKALENFTSSPLQGIILGTVATAVLQSSTIVGLMIMAFVGAGMLPLRNAIGVVLGANLGTTSTGWLVAMVGFKVDLTEFYVLTLGLGAVLSVMSKEDSKLQQSGSFIVAFGLLLFALVLMKDSVVFIIDLVDVHALQNLPIMLYFLIGVVLTVVIQSSTATMLITLSAMSAGIIELRPAAALVIGANLGTTSTIVLGSLKGSVTKRQIASVHFLFSLVVSVLAMLLLPFLLILVDDYLQLQDPLFALVALYTVINLAGIVLFFPFLDSFQRFVERCFPLPAQQALTIDQVSIEVPDAALAALEQDVRVLLSSALLLNSWRLGILDERKGQRVSLLAETAQASYAELKGRENRLSDYILELQRVQLTQEQVRRVQQLLVCIRDCLYSTKAVKDIEADLVRFRLESGVEVKEFINTLLLSVEKLFGQSLALLEAECCISSNDFKAMREAVRHSHTQSNVAIYRLIDQRGFRHDRASSALNINRELLLAAHSLINALEHFLLPGEQVATVSEWLSWRS
ncbi:MAG TPA: Na/Pi cotransporter family protein [Pseudomonadaceae bacterium]|nr:Na/Pi cotransporter family protein [Pseudomonadaceae bacterium]